MRKVAILFVPLFLMSCLTGCFESGEQKSLKKILEYQLFYQDRDYKSDALIFKKDNKFDYHYSDPAEQANNIDDGTFEYVGGGTYSWSGDWGYKGKSSYYIYRLNEKNFIREVDGNPKTYYMYFIHHDGLFYTYNREQEPTQEEIRDGTKGIRWYPKIEKE